MPHSYPVHSYPRSPSVDRRDEIVTRSMSMEIPSRHFRFLVAQLFWRGYEGLVGGPPVVALPSTHLFCELERAPTDARAGPLAAEPAAVGLGIMNHLVNSRTIRQLRILLLSMSTPLFIEGLGSHQITN
eukprot:scaffold5475_cov127-Isochrysis_galbana.AAC.10